MTTAIRTDISFEYEGRHYCLWSRNKKLYLRFRLNKKGKWISLRTADAQVAIERAKTKLGKFNLEELDGMKPSNDSPKTLLSPVQKSAKLDVRLTPELRQLVDGFAHASRLSRSQVVERALLRFFGIKVLESPEL
jgi:hypothetical protein